jgi:hypothetical protein
MGETDGLGFCVPNNVHPENELGITKVRHAVMRNWSLMARLAEIEIIHNNTGKLDRGCYLSGLST